MLCPTKDKQLIEDLAAVQLRSVCAHLFEFIACPPLPTSSCYFLALPQLRLLYTHIHIQTDFFARLVHVYFYSAFRYLMDFLQRIASIFTDLWYDRKGDIAVCAWRGAGAGGDGLSVCGCMVDARRFASLGKWGQQQQQSIAKSGLVYICK